jgi:hypothetical protein
MICNTSSSVQRKTGKETQPPPPPSQELEIFAKASVVLSPNLKTFKVPGIAPWAPRNRFPGSFIVYKFGLWKSLADVLGGV